MAKALVFGLVLATISAAWWTPKLLPEFQAGFFSSNLGWKTVLGIYLWHIVWSVHLAVIYNPLPAERSSAEAAAAPSVDVRIADPATARTRGPSDGSRQAPRPHRPAHRRRGD